MFFYPILQIYTNTLLSEQLTCINLVSRFQLQLLNGRANMVFNSYKIWHPRVSLLVGTIRSKYFKFLILYFFEIQLAGFKFVKDLNFP